MLEPMTGTPPATTTRSKLRRAAQVGSLFAVGAIALAACSSSPSANSTTTTAGSSSTTSAAPKILTPPSAQVTLTEAGSTLLEPLMQAWAPAYNKLYPNITVQASGGGSGAGISGATAGTVNIGASDAYLSNAQRSTTPSLLNIPVAISAQMVNYNLPGVSGNLKLNGTVLAKMFTGKITHWNDPAIAALNPGTTLPSTAVVPVHRSDGSGDTFLFTTFLSDSDPADWSSSNVGTSVTFPSVPGALAGNGNSGVIQEAKSTPGAVAYVGISYLAQTQQAGLGEAQLQNKSGNYVLPTAATIGAEASGFASSTPANGTISMIYGSASNGYPIINYEYAIVNAKQANANTASAIQAFLSWAINPSGGNTSAFLNAVNFQPLPAAVVAQSQTQLQTISAG